MQKNSRSKIRTKRKKSGSKFLLSALALIFFLIGISAAAYSSYLMKIPSKFWEDLIPIPEGNKINISIANGMNATQVARAFEIQGALSKGSPVELAHWFVKFGIDKRIRAGHYSVVPTDAWNLARQLRNAKPALLKAQILPGLDIFALIDAVESQDQKLTRKNFNEALLRDDNYPPELREVLLS
ncbi:MAG: hypothetical protein IJQ57_10580, partial [Synergistaceae bacterium]|nr:hypothetical protein [Synergistaceae bacterium]